MVTNCEAQLVLFKVNCKTLLESDKPRLRVTVIANYNISEEYCLMGFCHFCHVFWYLANCLTLTNSYGDYITDCCRNFFTQKCIPYVAHTTSHIEYQLKEIYLCSYVWNHLTWMSTLIFTSFLFCYITPWHLAALKSWGEKKKHLWCCIAKLQSRALL